MIARHKGTCNVMYVQSARLNGEVYMKNYIKHDFFLECEVLELTLGGRESTSWGLREESVPFSISTGMMS